MRMTIRGVPQFELALDVHTASLLVELGQIHYDIDCRTACTLGGFILQWHNIAALNKDEPHVPCIGTFHELDLTLKICEQRHTYDGERKRLLDDYVREVRRALSVSNTIHGWFLEL